MKNEADLSRFVEAQEDIYPTVIQELQMGKKSSHWMWFIFPQVKGLGSSSTAQFYSIKSNSEAKAFYDHPILGPRLLQCTEIILQIKNKSAEDIFGYPDYLKLKSSLTLFAHATTNPIFEEALAYYFNGQKDQRTLAILKR